MPRRNMTRSFVFHSFRLSGSRMPNLERIIPAAMVRASFPIHFQMSDSSGGLKLFLFLNIIGFPPVEYVFVLKLNEVEASLSPPRLNVFFVQMDSGNGISSCSSPEQSFSSVASDGGQMRFCTLATSSSRKQSKYRSAPLAL